MIIALLAAQAIIQEAPAYRGQLTDYDASCQFVLTDHEVQKIDFSLRGNSGGRHADARVDGKLFDAKVEITSPGRSGSGQGIITEVVVVSDGATRLRYGLQYTKPSPGRLEQSDVWALLPDGGLKFAGTGLCWTKGATN